MNLLLIIILFLIFIMQDLKFLNRLKFYKNKIFVIYELYAPFFDMALFSVYEKIFMERNLY